MESSLAVARKKVIPVNKLEILQRSQALNSSLGPAYPLVLAYMVSFDEMLHNLALYLRLTTFNQNKPLQEISYKDLCIYCKERHIIKGTLTDWMFYQALRRKISCNLDGETLKEIIAIAPKFCSETQYMTAELEKVIAGYRRYN